MKSKIIITVLLLLAVSGVFAQNAVITELTGTVEVKRADSAAWENASIGQRISIDTTISTSFKSSALISIGDSVIAVRPLTRMTLTEISSREGTETINVSLQAGRVRADIKPPAGVRASTSVQTPIATASVRGTVFEVDTFSLRVMEGSVEFRGNSGIHAVVDSGAYSFVNERTGQAALPIETLFSVLDPALPIASNLNNFFDGAGYSSAHDMSVTTIIEYGNN